MRKTFMGVQLRRLREERGLTQVALARTLGLSASYLNQIEQNQRPLTVPVLLKINAALGVDVQRFSDDEEARLIAGLGEVLADQGAAADARAQVSLAEVRELAASMPAVARTLIGMHTRYRQALERLEGADPQAQTDTATQAHELIRNPQEYGDLFARAAAAASPGRTKPNRMNTKAITVVAKTSKKPSTHR